MITHQSSCYSRGRLHPCSRVLMRSRNIHVAQPLKENNPSASHKSMEL